MSFNVKSDQPHQMRIFMSLGGDLETWPADLCVGTGEPGHRRDWDIPLSDQLPPDKGSIETGGNLLAGGIS